MLIVRGLLLAADGFIFIFMPAMLLPVLLRRQPEVNRSFVWWGAGAFLVALLPALFLSSLARQVMQPGNHLAARALLALISALVSGVLIVGAQYLLLRWRRPPVPVLPVTGLAVGLGVGIVTQVFTGFAHIGAGFRLLFGDTSTPELAALAAMPIGLFSLKLLAELMNRAVLFVVNGGLGYLVGRSLAERRGLLPLAMLLYAAFNLILPLIQLGLAEQEVLINGIAILVEGAIGGLALRWLLRIPPVEGKAPEKAKRKKA
ncbi:MAG: hypothetical protein ACETWR_03660 [Anaerolineae bacterium]